MKKEFNIGDRVRSKFYGVVGTITEIDTDGYILKPDTDDDMWIADTDVEPYDPKTAFLTRLQSLLREFDAEIRFLEGDKSPAIVFMGHKDEKTRFGKFIDGVVLYSKHCEFSSDTIMDYDKE